MDGAVGMVSVRVTPQDGAPVQSVPSSCILGLVRYEQVNGEHYIDLTTTRELPHGALVHFESEVDGNLREFVVWASSEPHEGDLVQRTYRCVWSLQAMLSASTSSAMPGTGGTPATATQALTALLSEQDAWEVGTVEPTATGSASFWRMTAWEGLAELVEEWGGEVDVVTENLPQRYVNLSNHIGSEEPAFTFLYGSSKVVKVERKWADAPLVSRIIPIGAAQETDSGGYGRKIDITSVNGGKAYLQDDTADALFADAAVRHPTCYVEQPDITDPAELKAWGQTVLYTYTRPQAEYEAELTERYALDGGYVPALGDEGVVIDEALGASLQVRVTSIEVATCATQTGELGAMAELVSNGPLSATTGGTGTTSASLLLTTTKSPYTSGITAYDRNINGHNTFWRSGGNLVIGAGEYADAMWGGDIGSCYTGTGENLYLGADTNVYIHAGANNIGERKTWVLSSSGNTTFPRGVIEAGNVIDLHTADDEMDFTGRLYLNSGQMAIMSTNGGYSSSADNARGRYTFM